MVRSQPNSDGGSNLLPRELNDAVDDDDGRAGFLYINESQPWPSDPDEVNERLPDEWFDDDGRLRPNRKKEVPQLRFVNPDGSLGDTGNEAWWIDTPFRFCLSCGVSYAGRLGRDYSRLATLGSDGRSTATTIMSIAALQYLRSSDDLPASAKKLLSFTDNRQDASLQAGHFNDFVQVTLLRAALYRAASDAGERGLGHEELPQEVFRRLDLPFEDYALEPDLKGMAKRDTDRALELVLAYRVYRDLERGWRLTQPNLEQTGLLRIDYESLDDLAEDGDQWADAHTALRGIDADQRSFILRTLLDTIRRELAIKTGVFDQPEQDRIKSRSDQRLAGSWSFGDERLVPGPVARPRARRGKEEGFFVSARGGFGQFLRRPGTLDSQGKLSLDDTDQIIGQLFEGLRVYGLLTLVAGEVGETSAEYQLESAAMRWVAGDGSKPYQDIIRMPNAPEVRRTNEFFVDLYKNVGDSLAKVEAREHTAQVSYDERQDREDRFRSGNLPVLFCSPTMELGVDISQLNVVNLRNVPPTPANYAQRSGRAGRSGQPALVFTYCTAGSSHDQHYFLHPEQMVAGQVEAPRMELANEDLLRSHIQAVWLSESGMNLKSSMTEVLDLGEDEDDPPVFPNIAAAFADGTTRAKAKVRAQAVLADLDGELSQAPWWHDGWLDDVLAGTEEDFNRSLKRWRSLYKSALQQAREQSKIKQSAATSSGDKVRADRLRRQAENRLELLRADGRNRGQSDFYPYRYLASEGFLPGYSFPRLPVSAFIPGRRRRGSGEEYLQRPRFLAISEFGPQSLVYHEGARYRINKVDLPVGELDSEGGGIVTQEAKQCSTCGYLHPLAGNVHLDVCERCGRELTEVLSDLFRLEHVSTVRRDLITSDEEERQRKGYEIITGLFFAERDGGLSVRGATVVAGDGSDLLGLAYGDTATIWRVNLGWRRRKVQEQHGFILDIESGYWGTSNDAEAEDQEDPMSNRTRRVIPYVEDSRNALLITPAESMGLEEMASLQAALKAALQVVFQLEEDEIAAEPLPNRMDRKVMLFYESAEGGAGVLRRLIDEPVLWQRVAKEALRRCHEDPVTGGPIPTRSDEPCEAACYECLLSYRNQPEHQVLDRHVAMPLLRNMTSARLNTAAPVEAALDAAVESSLEQEFLDFLRSGGFSRPDKAQHFFEDAGTRADFLYTTQRAAIFIDGPHHDDPRRRAQDAEQDAALRRKGLTVIRFGHRDDWSQLIDDHQRVFGEGTTE